MLPMAAGAERWTKAMRSLEAAFLIGVEGATEIWLVRHGDCYEDMPAGEDPPLSRVGRDQAARLAERVKHVKPAAIYSSPYRRAMQTAQAMSDDVHVDDRLIEMAMELSADGRFDFTEETDALIQRVGAAINDIAQAHPGRRVIVVTHGAAMISFLTHVLGLEPGTLRFLPYYTSVSIVRVLGDVRMVGTLGDIAHLE